MNETTKILEKFLIKIKSGEFLPHNNLKIFKPILDKLTYKLGKPENVGNTVDIEIKISSINLDKYLSELSNELEVTEEFANLYINDFFSDLMKKDDLEFSETTMTASFRKKDNKWIIANASEIVLSLMEITSR